MCQGEVTEAPVWVESARLGDLRVVGLPRQQVQRRLQLDADLIARLVQIHSGKQGITRELIHTRDQLLAIYHLAQATRDCWEIDRSLDQLAGEIVGILQSDATFLWLELDDGKIYTTQKPEIMLDSGIVMECYRTLKESNQPYLIKNCQESSYPRNDLSLLIVAIQLFEKQAGVLGIVYRKKTEFLSPDIKLASALAEFTGSLLENVLMFNATIEQARLQTEMQLAHDVQFSLLPRELPKVKGLDLWAFSQPASHVGGDFYDFIQWPDGSFTFVVGDISGKGMPAAMLMTVSRTIIRLIAGDTHRSSPKEILELSNAFLYEDLNQVNMFVTVFVGQYDASRKELVYANAGHAPVIYCPALGAPRLIKADSTALGILEQNIWRNRHLKLKTGDIFLVGSDGLFDPQIEKSNTSGYDYIFKIVDNLKDKPSRIIAENLNSESHLHALADPIEDDRTLIILKTDVDPSAQQVLQ